MNRVNWINGHPAPIAAAEATGARYCPGRDITIGPKAGRYDKALAANVRPCKAGNVPNG